MAAPPGVAHRTGPPPVEDPLAPELDTLDGRLYTPGDRRYGLPTEPLPAPRLVMHCRTA